MSMNLGRALRVATAAFLLQFGSAWAAAYSNIFVFGDSLADSGNNAYFFDNYTPYSGMRTPTPLSEPLIPTLPYASNRYSNGPVWTEYFAAALGLSAQAALTGGTNFAFAGARTGPAGSSFPYSMTDQVGMFLTGTGGFAPSSALYVVEGGGNDARDVLLAAGGGADPMPLIADYAGSMANIIRALALAGGDQFLVWNVPDIGKIPYMLAVDALYPGTSAYASMLAAAMNMALASALSTLDADILDGIHLFDAYKMMDDVAANPGAFGFVDASTPCAMSPACISNPSAYFFWDGIHPTTAGHALMARLSVAEIPEPQTLLLLALALIALAAFRRRPR